MERVAIRKLLEVMLAGKGRSSFFRNVAPGRLTIFQEMVLHPCTYRQHSVDSGSLGKEHTKLRGKSDRVEGSSGETGEKKHNVKC